MIEQDCIAESAVPLEGTPAPEAPADEQESTWIDVLTQLAHRKWVIAKVTGISMLAGAVLCFVLPVRYTANTKIMPPQQTQSAANLMMNQLTNIGGSSLEALAGAGLGLKNPNDIYIGMLTSRPVADAIIQKFGLQGEYGSKDMTAARKKLADYTEVISEKDGFISISVTDRNKQRVTEMANAYTAQLRVLTQKLAVTEASQRRLFYEDQLKQAKNALVTSELAFQRVQQKNGLVALNAQATMMIESLAALRAQVAAKQVEVQALRSYSTEQNPDVELAERELTSLRAEETRLAQRSPSPGIAGLGLGNVSAAGLEYLSAAHELAYRQELFDVLMKQYDAAKLDEAKEAAIIQVVEPAIVPDRKSSPKRGLILLLFTLMGFFVGCISARLLFWMERIQFDPDGFARLQALKCAVVGQPASDE